MFGTFGMQEMVLVGFIAILLFGPSMIRGLGKKMGENLRESKKAVKEIVDALKDDTTKEPTPKV